MRFFVTGASGWIGSATVVELLGAGHEVVGLARSDASAERIEAAGAIPYRGHVDDPDALAAAAADSDGVVHLAFNPAGLRTATALLTLSLRGVGVRSSVLRYPPTVHGDGDHGFVATFVELARRSGVSAYVGDGANRWPAVHRSDAARLTRMAAETAPAGSVLHAVGDQGVPFGEIAEAIGRHLGLPTKSLSPDEAVEHFGPLGHFVGLDSPADASITRHLLGWEPTGPGLLEDLEMGHHFKEKNDRGRPPAGLLLAVGRQGRLRLTAMLRAVGWTPRIPTIKLVEMSRLLVAMVLPHRCKPPITRTF